MSFTANRIRQGAAGAGGDYEIDSSLRFNDDDSAYLSWTPGSAGNRKTWTYSCWIKLGAIDTGRALFYGGDGSSAPWETGISVNSAYQISTAINGTASLKTTALYRDPSAWYHIVWAVDTTQATSTNRAKLYVNGSQITALATSNYPAQNDTPMLNNNVIHKIGQYSHATSGNFDGYLSEVNFIDGSALAPTDFGSFDATYGHWKAKKYAGSYTGNSFYLPFTNDTTNDHFNTVVYAPDGSTSFAVTGVGFQPDLVWLKSRTYAEDHQLNDSVRGVQKGLQTNLTAAETSQSNGLTSFDSDGFTVGNLSDYNYNGDSIAAWCWKAGGPHPFTDSSSSEHSITRHGGAVHSTAQNKIGNSGIQFTGNGKLSIPDSNDFDFSGNFTIEFWFNPNVTSGSWYNIAGNTDSYLTGASDAGWSIAWRNNYKLIFSGDNGSSNTYIEYQLPKTDWVIDGTTWYHIAVVRSSSVIKMYVDGTYIAASSTVSNQSHSISSSNALSIGTAGLDTSYNFIGYMDEFRVSNTARYTANFTPSTTAFTSDSNTKLLIHSDYDPSNTNGSITSQVSANPDQGFSIVSYTGTGSLSNSTVGHGMSSAPEMVIVKNRDGAHSWAVYHTSIPNSKALLLNSTSAQDSSGGYWNNTSTTSSVFTVGNGNEVNYSGNAFIAYCWHSVAGYSKISSYTGNGSTTGPVVTTGFKVGWLLVKCSTAAEDWWIVDNVRSGTNPKQKALRPSKPNAESDNVGYAVDFNSDGFQIKATSGQANANGSTYIYMAFADTSVIGDVTNDQSGLKNHWSGVNLTASDVMLDSPTNNFATFNPIQNNDDGETSEGNLKVTTGVSTWKGHYSTIGMSSGKWYAEFLVNVTGGWNIYGIAAGKAVNTYNNAFRSTSAVPASYGYGAGQLWVDGVTVSGYAHSTNAGDVVHIAVDLDNNKVYFGKNGTWDNSGNPSAGTGYTTIIPETYLFGYSFDHDAMAGNTHANFGQDATFAGNKSPSTTYSDGKYGEFHYQPPAGFKALCTQNLPNPAVVPGEHFNALTYTGDGQDGRQINADFQPDLIWTKQRNSGNYNLLIDSVRGNLNHLYSDQTMAERTSGAENDGVGGFNSSGYTVDFKSGWYFTNGSNNTYVSWLWKAGGTAVSNTSGSITTQVSANTAAGFSIVSYTGNGTSGATVGHGLSPNAPELVIVKSRSLSGKNWPTYHIDEGNTKRIKLNSTDAAGASSAWNNTTPSASLVTLGSQSEVNTSGATQIMYCFHSVDGYSKIGLYFGNGSADGPFIFTGFQPKYILWKQSRESGENWRVIDDTRSPYNQANKHLAPSSSSAESTETGLDFLSNGFKWRNADWHQNQNGKTYIYMAFAEYPFKYSTAR